MPFPDRGKKKLHGIILDNPVDSDKRCMECDGACCRSFSDVEITWEEFERLHELGATRLQISLTGHHHRLMIDYGCEFLSGGRCRIYDARPDVCRRFTCRD